MLDRLNFCFKTRSIHPSGVLGLSDRLRDKAVVTAPVTTPALPNACKRTSRDTSCEKSMQKLKNKMPPLPCSWQHWQGCLCHRNLS